MKMLYEGKAKQVFLTENPNEYIVHYKDDATAFNGEKKDQLAGKGQLNNAISSHIFTMLNEKGIKTHFIKQIDERDMLVKKVTILQQFYSLIKIFIFIQHIKYAIKLCIVRMIFC